METNQPHVETLNRIHFSNQESSLRHVSFRCFPRLPLELRLKIWKDALGTERRLFTVRLEDPDEVDEAAGYKISIQGKPRISPLWKTCRESRIAVREHFRLPLPIHKDSATLWLNPESDHLFLQKFRVETRTFIKFLVDLKKLDPHGTGLVHLAFDSLCGTTLKSLRALDPPHCEGISQENLRIFKECILRLQSVWFIHLLTSDSRLSLGASSGPMGLNRSIPVFPRCIEFNLFKSDPRPIQPSLKKQTVGYDPKQAVRSWLKMEKTLGFGEDTTKDESRLEPTREISHILAMRGRFDEPSPEDFEVTCPQSMNIFLEKEQEHFLDWFVNGPGRIFLHEIWQESEERKRNLLSAAGFWIFPQGTFDTLDQHLAGKACQDLSGRQPGLGLFDL